MINEVTKEQLIRKYNGILEGLRDNELIYGTVFIRGEFIEINEENKAQHINRA